MRPTAGGLAFGSGATATTAAVTNPEVFFCTNQWVPIVLGVVIALAVWFLWRLARRWIKRHGRSPTEPAVTEKYEILP